MPDVTFVVPAAPYHDALLERALCSIDAQTVPSASIVIHDHDQRGAGWARNQGIAQTQTPFLVFLDADDEVLPAFAERTLAAYRPGHFVYTDWYDEAVPFRAPKCPWVANTRNVITTLLRTDDVRRVGGFDEALGGMEDTYLYLKLMSSGVCGLHLPELLFRYRKAGLRSAAFYGTAAYHETLRRFTREFGRLPMGCGDCGTMPDTPPSGEQQSGDVLALALWNGNRQERGRATGRLYPRTGNGKQLWMSPLDIAVSPHLFRQVEAETTLLMPAAPPAPLDDLGAMMRFMTPVQDSPPKMIDMRPVAPVQAAPDVQKAVTLYQAAANG